MSRNWQISIPAHAEQYLSRLSSISRLTRHFMVRLRDLVRRPSWLEEHPTRGLIVRIAFRPTLMAVFVKFAVVHLRLAAMSEPEATLEDIEDFVRQLWK
jgi:hypothetical protein